MKSFKRIFLLCVTLITILLFVPNVCNAADTTFVNDEQSLRDAITKVNNGQISSITLSNSITVTGPLPEITKDLTLNGNGFKILGDDNWYANSGNGNQSIITSTAGTLTLKNLILQHGPKQGAQAYGNGKLILDGVTITDFKYSGLIANGGTIEIRDVNLNTNVGIEVGKSTTNPVESTPKVVMNGTIKTISKALLYEDPATKSKLTVENTENSTDKIFVTEDSIFITDKNNNVIYEVQNFSDIEIENSDMSEDNFVTVTIHYNEESMKLVVTKNDILSNYNLDAVKNVDGKVFVNFVIGDNEVFSEDTPITDNLELTAVYEDIKATPEKDETPKTGDTNSLALALVILSISILSIVALRRKF